jgi:hypothetical protein
MNFLSIASSLTLLAGGSIDGDKRPLDSSEIWGVLVAGLGVVMAVLALLVIIIFLARFSISSIRRQHRQKVLMLQIRHQRFLPPDLYRLLHLHRLFLPLQMMTR